MPGTSFGISIHRFHTDAVLVLLAVVTIAAVVAAACGDDDGDLDEGPISGVGPGISIAEALASKLEGPLLVNGICTSRTIRYACAKC